jgi:hypothetical protein
MNLCFFGTAHCHFCFTNDHRNVKLFTWISLIVFGILRFSIMQELAQTVHALINCVIKCSFAAEAFSKWNSSSVLCSLFYTITNQLCWCRYQFSQGGYVMTTPTSNHATFIRPLCWQIVGLLAILTKGWPKQISSRSFDYACMTVHRATQ